MGRRLEELFHRRRRTALARLKLLADTLLRRIQHAAKLADASHRLLLKKNDLLHAFFCIRSARGTRGSRLLTQAPPTTSSWPSSTSTTSCAVSSSRS